MNKLLPQANNLDTVVDVFRYIYLHPGCSKENIADFCGFTLRQVEYYTNACEYLGLINATWEPTIIGKDIFERNLSEVTERVYAQIILDPVMGQIFAMQYTLPEEDHSEFARQVVMDAFPGYSDAVYERRSDIIIKWCKKIIAYLAKK